MMRMLLELLGRREPERCDPPCGGPSDAEQHYEQEKRLAEQTMRRAEVVTRRARQAPSWESLLENGGRKWTNGP